MMWTVRVFICLAHPSLCIIKIKKTTNLLHRGRWKNAGLSPYNELQAQFFKQEAASGAQRKRKLFGHFIKELASLCFFFTISGMSPSLPRSPVQSQPPYSRVETHGRRVTSWSPLGFRTEAKKEGKKKERRADPPSSSDGCVSGPTGASAACKPHQWLNGGRTEGASRI